MVNNAPCFNLVDEPWIPLIDRGGGQAFSSLSSLVEDAPAFVKIGGEVPTQSFALLRLVLAIIHRALADPRTGVAGPADLDEWASLVSQWPRLVGMVHEYLEAHRNRFYLYHPSAPFFQVANLETSKGLVGEVTALIADVPAGRQFLTMRSGSGAVKLTRAEAARWLVHVHAYDVSGIHSGAVGDSRVKAGKGYGIGTGWCGKLGGVHLVGRTLQETILMNLLPFSEVRVESRPDDLPPWERAPLGPGVEAPGREPKGPIELYTWQSRRIRLFDDGEHVFGAIVCQGDPVDESNRIFLEPMTAWMYSKAQSTKRRSDVYRPRSFDPERSLWRGLEALLPAAGAWRRPEGPARYVAPRLAEWAALLAYYGETWVQGGLCRLRAVGLHYGVQQAVVDELVDDELSLPWQMFGGSAAELTGLVLSVLDATEDAVSKYGQFTANLRIAAGCDPQAAAAVRARATAELYAELDSSFRAWLVEVSDEEEVDLLRVKWYSVAREVILRRADDEVAHASASSWIGREVSGRWMDAGLAERCFRRGLNQALPVPTERVPNV